MTEPVAPETPAERRRGRPRPEATIERDQQVYAALEAGPKTKKELAEATALPANQVYLSIYRLRKSNQIKKVEGKAHTWERVEAAVAV
jgi:predicted Rossmann fold nucleotide-binding protein DprA/Smf involved in DNA uptake